MPVKGAGVATRYSRILLKLSGESLGSDEGPFDHQRLSGLAQHISRIAGEGIEIGIVVGGGNLFRARSANLDVLNRVTADHVGMLATLMNATVLRDYLRAEGARSVILSPREVPPLSRSFSRDLALPLFKSGTVLIFGGGTGNPFFTTDTAAALRAVEIEADVLLKGTQVDGVYDKDPLQHTDAVRFDFLTYDEVLDRRLGVMDLTAITLCKENGVPIEVFDISDPRNIMRLLNGEIAGTRVAKEPKP
ncbi:UMP kinase [bacterium]|nr:UMP kinase [bacterium]